MKLKVIQCNFCLRFQKNETSSVKKKKKTLLAKSGSETSHCLEGIKTERRRKFQMCVIKHCFCDTKVLSDKTDAVQP